MVACPLLIPPYHRRKTKPSFSFFDIFRVLYFRFLLHSTKSPLSRSFSRDPNKALECLVRLASVRRSLFVNDAARSKFLAHLMTGTKEILQSGQGLADHDNYHEYCRLLGRFRVNYQAGFPDDLSENPLDNVELLQDQLDCFPYLCRFQREHFPFLEEHRCSRSRTTFYYTIGWLIFMEDSPVKFRSSMEPLLQILKTLFEIVLFEDCGNQWSLSRPMLSLILISEQPMDQHQRHSVCFDKLMQDVTRSLDSKNRDRFTQNLTVFRHEFRLK
ncbi:hypothetical protein V6N13_061871 [Hibiscus sabdariffa]